MFKTVESVVMFVEDINAAASWYAQITGCDIQYENEQYAFITLGVVHLGFHPADHKNTFGTTGSVAYWEVDDVGHAIEQLTQAGASLYRGPMVTELGSTVAMLCDPFGNVFGINTSPPLHSS